jgi:hypothetical protein
MAAAVGSPRIGAARAQHAPQPSRAENEPRKESYMDASEKGRTERKAGSAEAKDRVIAIIGARACIAVAVIAAALLLLS